MRHFAVVAMPRSGSTRICEILGRHPSVACHQEIFHPHEVQAHFPKDRQLEVLNREARDGDPETYLSRFLDFAETWFSGRTHHGFKVLLSERQVRAATRIVCPNRRLDKIVLHRENLLACYTSIRLARETGVWQRVDGGPPKNEDHKLVFERHRFFGFAGQQLLAHGAAIALLRQGGHRFLEIEYGETLTAEGLDRVWRFLGLPPVGVSGTFRKANTRPILDCYSDPDEVRTAMHDIGRSEWLAGVGSAGPSG